MISIIKNMPLIMSIASFSLSATAPAVIDSQLEQKLQNMTATDSTMVVVSYDQLDALTTTQLQNLLNFCLAEGVQFKSLPIVGVMATANQNNHMAAMPDISSVFANRSLEYYNAEARKITDVKKLQSSTFKNNNGIKFNGKGDTAIANDSGIDATLDDLEYSAKVVENVQGVTHAQALSLTVVDGMWIEGHVNAYAAVAGALGYDEQNPATVNNLNTFNANANIIDDKKPEAFWLLFSPVGDPETHVF
jgi:serine protease AprX